MWRSTRSWGSCARSPRISPQLELHYLTEGKLISQPGDPLLYVYSPSDALLSLQAVVDGVKVIGVAMVGREGMCGVACAMGATISSFQTRVQHPGNALRMQATDFVINFQEYAKLREAVIGYVLSMTVEIAQTAACAQHHLLSARLAKLLLTIRDHISSNHFYITHESLSQLLGVRRVGVTNAASALKALHFIDYNRGYISILNGGGLAGSACSCYGAEMKQRGGTHGA